MTTRITGLATGLDTDTLVKTELSAYQTKIDAKQQEKDVLEIKQEMYRDVLKKGSDLYSKYFDILSNGSLLSSKTFSTTSFTSSNENIVTAKATGSSAIKDNYSVTVEQLAQTPKTTFSASMFDAMKASGDGKINFTVGEKSVEIDITSIIQSTDSDEAKLKSFTDVLNDKLSSLGMKATHSKIAEGVVIESTTSGEVSEFTISGTGIDALDQKFSGKDCKFTITNSSGHTYESTSSTNTLNIDGIEFTFNATTGSEKVSITGKTDGSSATDAIAQFFEDYNSMITDLTKLVTDKHNRNYSPLTAEQKKEMSEKEIELWEEKVKNGQLYRDSSVTSLINQLKSVMSSATSELKSIGITAVSDYGSKNGTYNVDKDALKAALESDPDKVMKIFNKAASTAEDGKTSAGVFTNLKTVLYDNCKSTSKSAIIKKAGLEGNDSNATITLQISKYATKISEMQSDIAKREQNLYSKYASLEKIMNSYNNQLSNMTSLFSS